MIYLYALEKTCIVFWNGQNAGVFHHSSSTGPDFCFQDVRFLVAAAYLSTPSTEILGVAEVSFESGWLDVDFWWAAKVNMDAQFLVFCRSCSFFNGWNLMIVLDLYFVYFSERCTKRQFFWGSRRVSQESSLPLRHRSFLPQFLAALPAVAWPTEDRIRRGDKNTSECWDFLRFAYFEGNICILFI